MAKPKPDELAEELKKQEDEVYGTGYTDGDPEKFGDTEDMLEDVIGNSPVGDEEEEEEDGFSIADAVAKDEEAAIHNKPQDAEEKELETELEKAERKEKHKEDASNE